MKEFDNYKDIVESIADGVRVLDKEEKIIYANRAYCALLGYNEEEIIGKPVYDLYPPEAYEQVRHHIQELKDGKKICYETTVFNKAHEKLYIKISSVPIFDKNGAYQNCYTVVRDITEKKNFEKKLIHERNFLDDMVSLCPDSIIGVNREGIVIIFNQASEILTGYRREEVIGKMSITQIYGSVELARMIKKKIHSTELGKPGQLKGFETYIVARDSHKIPIRLSAALIERDGNEMGSVGYFHDLTVRKQLESKLRELSITDSLSGLYNQRHFYTILTEEMSKKEIVVKALSLICFDIDNFKQCNDKLGHLEGDNIIRTVGHILREKVRSSDYAFRYGGDEFMILLPQTSLDDAHFSAERIRREFNSRWSFDSVFDTSKFKQISLSLGVAQANPDEMPDTFIKRADLAMYEAKRAGGNQTVKARDRIGKKCLEKKDDELKKFSEALKTSDIWSGEKDDEQKL